MYSGCERALRLSEPHPICALTWRFAMGRPVACRQCVPPYLQDCAVDELHERGLEGLRVLAVAGLDRSHGGHGKGLISARLSWISQQCQRTVFHGGRANVVVRAKSPRRVKVAYDDLVSDRRGKPDGFWLGRCGR